MIYAVGLHFNAGRFFCVCKCNSRTILHRKARGGGLEEHTLWYRREARSTTITRAFKYLEPDYMYYLHD